MPGFPVPHHLLELAQIHVHRERRNRSSRAPSAGHNELSTFNIFQRLSLESFLVPFSRGSSHVWMWELDHKEGWTLKNWCFPTVVLDKTLEDTLGCKEIKPVNPKSNQSWIFIGRTDAEAEAPILWPPDAKSWHIKKDPDAGKDWRQEEKGTTEDDMVGWHHQLDGHEFEQVPGDVEGQGSLAWCSPWGYKKSDITGWPNNNKV